jgi:single-strand DNA-binding protein
MLPKVTMVGRVVRDPEIETLNSGTEIAKFTLVSSEKFGDKESTCFIECVAFGGLASKVIAPYVKKGNQIYITGKLKLDSWVAQDGSKKSKHSITIEGLEMLGSSGKQSTQNEQRGSANSSSVPPISTDDSDIPF